MLKQKRINSKKTIAFLGLILIIPVVFLGINQLAVNGYETFVSSSSDMDTLKVKSLEASVTYNFSLTYSKTFGDSFDLGFAIYKSDAFRESGKLLTQDDAGDDFESALFTPTEAGDYFIGIWMNGDDYGFVTIKVTEDGTTNEKTIQSVIPSITSNLRWLWIFLGVSGGVLILFGIGATLIVSRIASANKDRIADALAKGIALPRAGRNKDKCPFCGVKLPDHYLSQCPYCNAPITDEE